MSNKTLREAAEAALPALELLGDYIGNTFAGKVGYEPFDRCQIILDLKIALGEPVCVFCGPDRWGRHGVGHAFPGWVPPDTVDPMTGLWRVEDMLAQVDAEHDPRGDADDPPLCGCGARHWSCPGPFGEEDSDVPA